MLPIRIILHPSDFSSCSDNAFELASSLARDYGARVVVLHVATPTTVAYGEGVLPAEPEWYLDKRRERLQQLVGQKPKLAMEQRLVQGDAATEILRVAEDVGCDLIVMGTHGRTGLGRLVMGSVAEQVVRKARCPVLTIKSPLRQAPPAREPDLAQAAEVVGVAP
jgi:nucleotide-binding universal stress UspA family protein